MNEYDTQRLLYDTAYNSIFRSEFLDLYRAHRRAKGSPPQEFRVDAETEQRWRDAVFKLTMNYDAAPLSDRLPCAFRGIPIVYGCERFEAASFRPQTDVFVVNQG